jgi:hypothetical protein
VLRASAQPWSVQATPQTQASIQEVWSRPRSYHAAHARAGPSRHAAAATLTSRTTAARAAPLTAGAAAAPATR